MTEPHDALYSTATMAAQEWWDSQQKRWRPIFEDSMTEPKSNADRQREFRQRKLAEKRAHKDAGRAELRGIYTYPECVESIKTHAARETARAERKRGK